MISLPIPIMSSLALFGFLIWMLLRDGRLSWFAILITVCTAQGILITLVQHYEISTLQWVQPLGAALIPPLGLDVVSGHRR